MRAEISSDTNGLQAWCENYLTEQKAVFDSIPVEPVTRLVDRLRSLAFSDNQIFVFGNGGSACSALHFITDLGKGASDRSGRRFRCLSLNDNVGWITALGNDYSYEDVFARQLMNHGKPGDLAMTMSVSGDSSNLVKAIEWAVDRGLFTVALVGKHRGRLAEIAHEVIVVDSEHYGRVEDAHMAICHMLCYAFIERGAQIMK